MKTTKYPSTYHLPWSNSIINTDKVIQDTSVFVGKRVIVSEKMDGENVSMYHATLHARSLDSVNHPSRNWVKNFWATIHYNIPQDIKICGENCYAKHSIHYSNLPSYFLGFSAWKENTCLGWDDTVSLFAQLGMIPVKVIYDGIYDENIIRKITVNEVTTEGYVLRIAGEFMLQYFNTCVGKYVRSNHVQTDKHWMKNPIVPNILGAITL